MASDRWAKNRVNFTKNSGDYIILDLFFDNLVYTEINEQELVSTTILFSQIGGQLSIWLGVRFITVIHIFYYGTIMLFGLCPTWKLKIQRRLRKKRVEETLLEDSTRTSTDDPPSYRKTLIQISPVMEEKSVEKEEKNDAGSPLDYSSSHLTPPHPLITENRAQFLW